jgi:hypothetical protein
LELNVGAQKVAALVEEALGLLEGAIWPAGVRAKSGAGSAVYERACGYERVLAYVVRLIGIMKEGKNGEAADAMFAELTIKYEEEKFSESLEDLVLRHYLMQGTLTRLLEVGQAVPKEVKRKLSDMQDLLVLTKLGRIEINTCLHKVSSKLEEILGLAAGDIWPEGLRAPHCADMVLLELIRRYEQLRWF